MFGEIVSFLDMHIEKLQYFTDNSNFIGREMVCSTLLLITILTVTSGATPLYCSDVQLSASGDHHGDLSQVISLHYCIIDNCTIMRIDTGQQLDIVYTTESLLVVTPVDGHTSMEIAKIDDEMPCLEYHNTVGSSQIAEFLVAVTLTSVMFTVSGYIFIVHLLFKELHTIFGKLLMFYSFGVMSMAASVTALVTMHLLITVNSQMICHTTMIIFIMASVAHEVFAANILTHLAYTMYRCYKLKSGITTKRKQFLFRCYTSYAFVTLVLLFFLVITYDWSTANGKYTLLPNGHCAFVDQYSYITLFLAIPTNINKLIQITMFIAYIVYFIKFNMMIRAAQTTMRYNRDLFKIAVAMGATLGLSYVFHFHIKFIILRRHLWNEWCFSFNNPTVRNHDILPMHKKDVQAVEKILFKKSSNSK